jgi:NDP-sugar pyrophosphorylase family protein
LWWQRYKIRINYKKIPKSLVEIKGKPIIWYILNILKKNKFNHFILPIGYKEDKLKAIFKKKIFRKFNLKIISTGVNTPIAKRIFSIKKYIKSDDFLLLNGDAIFDFDLYKIYRKSY